MKIGLVSIGTGGTGGHSTLLSKIGSSLQKKHELFMISEYDYSKLGGVQTIKYIKLQQQKHQQSIAGKLNHGSSEQAISAIKDNRISSLIFSTFFDQKILDYAKKQGIQTTLITYPLRDSFAEYFFAKGFDKLFDSIIALDDIVSMDAYASRGVSIASYDPKIFPVSEKDKSILISCGGGGRPSAKRFFEMVKDNINYLEDCCAGYNVVISTGAHDATQSITGKNIASNNWIKDWGALASKASLVIGEAGYFSIQELIAGRTPGIIIPGERRMDNQELRAVNYETKGMGKVILPQEDAQNLAIAIKNSLCQEHLANCQKACQEYTYNKNFPTLDCAINKAIEGKK